MHAREPRHPDFNIDRAGVIRPRAEQKRLFFSLAQNTPRLVSILLTGGCKGGSGTGTKLKRRLFFSHSPEPIVFLLRRIKQSGSYHAVVSRSSTPPVGRDGGGLGRGETYKAIRFTSYRRISEFHTSSRARWRGGRRVGGAAHREGQTKRV